jgi:hypothetical protein
MPDAPRLDLLGFNEARSLEPGEVGGQVGELYDIPFGTMRLDTFPTLTACRPRSASTFGPTTRSESSSA